MVGPRPARVKPRVLYTDCCMGIRWLLVVVFLCGMLHPVTNAQKAAGQATAEGLYRQALAALQHNNPKAAEADLRKAIGLAPGHADAHNALGWILLSQRQLP